MMTADGNLAGEGDQVRSRGYIVTTRILIGEWIGCSH